MTLRNKIVLALLLASLSGRTQDLLVITRNYGANAGLIVSFGTHINRVGFSLNFFYVRRSFQVNSEARLYYSIKNLGPPLSCPELVVSQGLVYGYGSTATFFNPFLSSISNQTGLDHSFAYSFNWYVNTIKTKQQTGILSIQVRQISFLAENDILARPAHDRFRTGAFLLQFQHQDIYQAGINCTLWTGKMGHKSGIINPKFHYQCYMDTAGSVYAPFSHGLLSAQFKYRLPYAQTAQLNLGIDAEQVRNAVQNEIIHDMQFIPKRWNKSHNCHIPMLDSEGAQYLYKENQKIRKPRPFLNAHLNHATFY